MMTRFLILDNKESCLSVLKDEVLLLGNKDEVPGLLKLSFKITKGALGTWFEKDAIEMPAAALPCFDRIFKNH